MEKDLRFSTNGSFLQALWINEQNWNHNFISLGLQTTVVKKITWKCRDKNQS